MVKIAMKVSFTAENITLLSTSGPNFQWNIKVQCRNCNEIDEKWHSINENEELEGKKGHSTSNFQMKCKFCSNFSSLDVLKETVKPIKVDENGTVEDQTAVVFDCRGLEPVEFEPRSGWIAINEESNSEFNDVDFTENENSWCGFDEKAKVPVSIDEFSSTFHRG